MNNANNNIDLLQGVPSNNAARPQLTVGPAALVLPAWVTWRLLHPGEPVFPINDAYITLHNARTFLGQPDANFAVPALVGATSTVHAVLVALVGLLLPLPWALDTTLWLGVLLYATGVCTLARMAGSRPLPAVLFTAAALLAGRTVYQLLNGLETGLAMGAIVWAFVAASTSGRRAALTLAALCGLLPFLRPELIALSLLLLPIPAIRLARSGQWKEAARLLLQCVVLAVACAAPWLLLNLWNAGAAFPATVGAKQAWFAERDLPLATKRVWVGGEMRSFLLSFGAISVLALLLVWRTLAGMAGAMFAAAVVAAFWINMPGGLGHYHQRYLFVVAPVLVFAAAGIFRHAPRRWHYVVASALLAQCALFSGAAFQESERSMSWTRSELSSVAAWSRANLPPDSVMLIHDAGYIAWATPFRMVDLVGLKTPASIDLHRQITLPSGGERRAEAIELIAMHAKATHLVVLDSWDQIFHIREGLVAHGWAAEPARTSGAYKVYRLSRPPLH
jgi:hypothetical protein